MTIKNPINKRWKMATEETETVWLCVCVCVFPRLMESQTQNLNSSSGIDNNASHCINYWKFMRKLQQQLRRQNDHNVSNGNRRFKLPQILDKNDTKMFQYSGNIY